MVTEGFFGTGSCLVKDELMVFWLLLLLFLTWPT